VESGLTNASSGWVLGKTDAPSYQPFITTGNTQEWYKMSSAGSYSADGIGINLNGTVFTISSEISTRTSYDNSLSTSISTEQSVRGSVDTSLTSRVSTEESLRTSYDNSLSTSISTEQSVRGSVDTSLTTRISTEESVRTSNVTSLSTNISTEISLRISGDTSLTSRVSTEESVRGSNVTSLTTRVSTEESVRSSNVTSLTTRVSTEESVRTSNVTSLTTRISTEESVRASGITSLSTVVSTETSVRASADTSLTTRISTEESIRTSADASLSTVITTIGSVTGITSLSTAISTEQSVRSSVDSSLSIGISTETSTRITSDNGKVTKSGDTMTGDLTINADLFVNGDISLPTANSKITANSGLVFEQTGDEYGTTRLFLQNRTGVNGALFQQAGTVDLVDFVFSGLTNQRNIRFENRTESPYGTLTLPLFKIGGLSPDDATLYIADNGSALMNGNVGINTLSPAYTIDVSGTSRVTGNSIFNSDVSITGSLRTTGITYHSGVSKYTSDLSGSYDTRTLVDKGYVDTALNLKANLTSPAFSGTPTSTTATVNTNTTQIATTAYVVGQASATNPLMNGTVVIGTSLRYSREDHIHASDTSRVTKSGDTMTGSLRINANLSVTGDTFITGSTYLGNVTSGNTNQYFMVIDSVTKKVANSELAYHVYGSEYQLAQNLTSTSTTSTTPIAKVTMTTTSLPSGTYKIMVSWRWSKNTTANSARFNLTVGGVSQGTRPTLEMEAGDTTDIRTEYMVFYKTLTGVNTIVFNYWTENSGNANVTSDASIELIRVQ